MAAAKSVVPSSPAQFPFLRFSRIVLTCWFQYNSVIVKCLFWLLGNNLVFWKGKEHILARKNKKSSLQATQCTFAGLYKCQILRDKSQWINLRFIPCPLSSCYTEYFHEGSLVVEWNVSHKAQEFKVCTDRLLASDKSPTVRPKVHLITNNFLPCTTSTSGTLRPLCKPSKPRHVHTAPNIRT